MDKRYYELLQDINQPFISKSSVPAGTIMTDDDWVGTFTLLTRSDLELKKEWFKRVIPKDKVHDNVIAVLLGALESIEMDCGKIDDEEWENVKDAIKYGKDFLSSKGDFDPSSRGLILDVENMEKHVFQPQETAHVDFGSSEIPKAKKKETVNYSALIAMDFADFKNEVAKRWRGDYIKSGMFMLKQRTGRHKDVLVCVTKVEDMHSIDFYFYSKTEKAPLNPYFQEIDFHLKGVHFLDIDKIIQ